MWIGGKTTVWNDVEVLGGWQEFTGTNCGVNRGKHYWFGSHAGNYSANCDDSWFFGSEIAHQTSLGENTNALNVNNVEVHVYGSTIRAANKDINPSYLGAAVTAISASGTAEVHIHGTGIDAISVLGNPVTALSASNGAKIHVNATSYNLSTGTGGTVTRIANNGGHIHAPYLWEEHPAPPNITSQDGADIAVVTTPAGTPSMVIYSTACASKWFDVGANACRP
jgi:hypothetical protein